MLLYEAIIIFGQRHSRFLKDAIIYRLCVLMCENETKQKVNQISNFVFIITDCLLSFAETAFSLNVVQHIPNLDLSGKVNASKACRNKK